MNALKYWSGFVLSSLRAKLYALRPGKRTLVKNDRVRNSPLYDDVCAWQKTQMESMTFENDCPTKEIKGTVDLPLMRRIHRRTLLEIKHELGDLWRPSSVTMSKGRGISLDQSIAIMHRLRDAGFPDDAWAWCQWNSPAGDIPSPSSRTCATISGCLTTVRFPFPQCAAACFSQRDGTCTC
jgi:hypothetical protein